MTSLIHGTRTTLGGVAGPVHAALNRLVRSWPRLCENSGVENKTCMRVLWFVVFPAIIPNN